MFMLMASIGAESDSLHVATNAKARSLPGFCFLTCFHARITAGGAACRNRRLLKLVA